MSARHEPRRVPDHARVAHVYTAADLFVSLGSVKPAERPRRSVVVPYGHDGLTFHFYEFWSLDVADQTVFLAILGMTPIGLAAGSTEIMPRGEALMKLRLAGGAADRDSLEVHTTAYELCQSCNWEPSGKRRRLLYQSLERLSHTSFDIRDQTGRVLSGGIVVQSAVDPTTGQLRVAINPYLARIFTERPCPIWERVNLDERRGLNSDVARLVHTWLSAWLRPGRSGRVNLDTLSGHVWPGAGPGTPEGTVRRHRHDVRTALGEIEQLRGWHIAIDRHGLATISRPGDRPRRIRRRKAH